MTFKAGDRVTHKQGNVWFEGRLLSLKGTVTRVVPRARALEAEVDIQWDGISTALREESDQLRLVNAEEESK